MAKLVTITTKGKSLVFDINFIIVLSKIAAKVITFCNYSLHVIK